MSSFSKSIFGYSGSSSSSQVNVDNAALALINSQITGLSSSLNSLQTSVATVSNYFDSNGQLKIANFATPDLQIEEHNVNNLIQD